MSLHSSSENDRIEIAIAGDSNYMVPLTVLLHSLFSSNSDAGITVNFLYITSAIQESELADLEDFIVYHGHRMRRLPVSDEQLELIPESRHTKSSSLRLLLPESLPGEVSKIIYLDGDIVVCDSLLPLYRMNITDHYVAAVKDSANVLSRKHLENIGFPPDAVYFNAGVMLMNIDRMRKERVVESFFAYLRDHADVTVAVDQDTLNVVLHEAVTFIHPKFNYNFWLEKDVASRLYTREELKEVKENPVVVHYIGPVKPWHCKSIHPRRSLWWKYLKQTGYKDFKSPDRNFRNTVSYFFLYTFIRPVKPLLTVRIKQRLGRLLPPGVKKMAKRTLFRAQ